MIQTVVLIPDGDGQDLYVGPFANPEIARVWVEKEQAPDWWMADLIVPEGLVSDGEVIPADVWSEDGNFLRTDWQEEVRAGDTQLGYWAWVSHRRDEAGA